jgi:hypothetical protein
MKKIILILTMISGISGGVTSGAFAEGQDAALSGNVKIIDFCIKAFGIECCVNEQLRVECH